MASRADPEGTVFTPPSLFGVPWLPLVWATAVAILVGVVYTLSPMTVWFGVAAAMLLTWAGRGLGSRERRWVVGLLVVAMIVRVLGVVGFFLLEDYNSQVFMNLFGDALHAKLRSVWLRHAWMGTPLSPDDFSLAFNPWGWTSYHYVLAYLQVLVGPAPYGLHLFNTALFVLTGIMLHRTVRAVYGPVPALGGLAALLFLPSLFVWSVSTTKDTFYFFLTSVALVGAVRAVRSDKWYKRVLTGVVALGALSVVDSVRPGGLFMVAGGIAAGLAARLATLRVWLCGLILTVTVVTGWHLLSRPDVQRWTRAQIRVIAEKHMGHVNTVGHSYKLLDPQFYTGDASLAFITAPEVLRYGVRAAVSFVVVPFPWQMTSAVQLAFLPQQIVWYVLVGLAAAGLVAGLRRDAAVTFILAGYVFVGAGTVALTSGNVGTLLRHRDMMVPVVVWLSALGADVVLRRVCPVGGRAASELRGEIPDAGGGW